MKDRHGSIIVNLLGGESLPAFYFHDDASNKGKGPSGGPPSWGGQELLQHLEQVSDIVGSAIEPGVYLVNASQADKVNHGSASPPQASPISHPLLPDVKDAHMHNESLYPKLDIVDPLRSETDISMGASSPNAEDTAVATATGPITIEGMRRRRSLSNQESRTRQGPSSSPIVGSGSPGPSGRSRTPLPFENHIDPIVNVSMEDIICATFSSFYDLGILTDSMSITFFLLVGQGNAMEYFGALLSGSQILSRDCDQYPGPPYHQADLAPSCAAEDPGVRGCQESHG